MLEVVVVVLVVAVIVVVVAIIVVVELAVVLVVVVVVVVVVVAVEVKLVLKIEVELVDDHSSSAEGGDGDGVANAIKNAKIRSARLIPTPIAIRVPLFKTPILQIIRCMYGRTYNLQETENIIGRQSVGRAGISCLLRLFSHLYFYFLHTLV